MKKQLLAAAVAATMTSVAMADISITGAAKINYTNVDYDSASVNDSDTFKHEMDLKVKGQNGDTTVVINFGDIDASTSDTTSDSGMNIEDAYVSTKVGDVSIKAGQWDNGNNALRASARADGKFSASTTISGITVTYDAANLADDTVKVAGSIGPVALSYKDVKTGEDISVSTSVGGINVSYLALNRDTANTDLSVVEVSGSVGGVDVKVARAEADTGATIEGDTWMGDFEGNTSGAYDLTAGQDVTSVSIKTAMAGNTVEFRNTQIDDVASSDTSFNKFIVTRPLANGTTFEATYTDLDDDGSTTTDSTTLDLELAVKF